MPLPAGFWPLLILDTLTVVAAVLVSFLYHQYLGGGGTLLRVTLGLVLFSLLSMLELLLTKRMRRRFIVLLLEVAALGSFFVFDGTPWLYLGYGALGALLFFLWGEAAGRHELTNGLGIRFFHTVKPQLTKYMTGLVFLGILLYLPHVSARTSLISESQFKTIFDWGAGATKNFYPEFKLTGSVQEFAQSVVESKLKTMPEFKTLTPGLQVQSLAQSTTKLVEQFGSTLGTTVEAEQSVSAVLYAFLADTLERWQQQLGDQFLFLWAIAAFFIVRGLGIFFYLIVSFLGFVVYEGLVALGAIHIVGESRMHEVVEFS